jgi:hypothetical protein
VAGAAVAGHFSALGTAHSSELVAELAAPPAVELLVAERTAPPAVEPFPPPVVEPFPPPVVEPVVLPGAALDTGPDTVLVYKAVAEVGVEVVAVARTASAGVIGTGITFDPFPENIAPSSVLVDSSVHLAPEGTEIAGIERRLHRQTQGAGSVVGFVQGQHCCDSLAADPLLSSQGRSSVASRNHSPNRTYRNCAVPPRYHCWQAVGSEILEADGKNDCEP